MPRLDVYYSNIPKTLELERLSNLQRQSEIDRCSNISVKRQKYFAWRLLEYALQNSFGIALENTDIHKAENGQLVLKDRYVSLSHSKDAVAVAVSSRPVGVDIELIAPFKHMGLERKLLTENEMLRFEKLEQGQQQEYLLKKWTAKESEFKRKGEKLFLPSETVVTADTRTVRISVSGNDYFLSVTGNDVENYNIYNKTFI